MRLWKADTHPALPHARWYELVVVAYHKPLGRRKSGTRAELFVTLLLIVPRKRSNRA